MGRKKWTHGHVLPLIGGCAIGATERTGNRPEWIASWDSVFKANDSYARKYFDEVPYFNLDEGIFPSKKVDIVTALPPCAGLSSSNTYKEGESSNPRGCNAPSNLHMLYASQFAMEKIRPKVMMVENAPALWSRAGEPFAERINRLAHRYGYSMSLVKTSTIMHGLPQVRPRSFFFLWDGLKVPILNPVSKPYKPFHELMQQEFHKTDLVRKPEPLPSDDAWWQFICEKNPTLNKQEILAKYAHDRIKSVYRTICDEGWLEEFVSWVEKRDPKVHRIALRAHMKREGTLNPGVPPSDILDATMKLAWDRTSSLMWKTLPNLVHPYEDRWLMISEALAIMGFPPDFAEKVEIPQRMSNVVCQNVPAKTAGDWLDEAMAALDGEREWVDPPIREDGTRSILRQSNITVADPMKPRWKL